MTNTMTIRACLSFLLSLALLLILSCNGNSRSHSGNSGNDTQQNEQAQAVSSAYEYIYDAMDRDIRTFSVYTDADAGGNHFAPSGYFNGTPNGKYPGPEGRALGYPWKG
jgi:hypothetical protein